jgi:hypothetical protein
MMKATGWQPHSVRGFLTAVVRKKLDSEKIGEERVYRIVANDVALKGWICPSCPGEIPC